MAGTYSRLATRGFANLKQCSIDLGKYGIAKTGLVSTVVGAERSAFGGTDFVELGPVGHGWVFQRADVVVVHFAAGSRQHAGLGFRHVRFIGIVCTEVRVMKNSFQLINFG